MAAIIDAYRPALTFVDPLRVFFPKGDGDNNQALIDETNRLTRNASTAWMITHHLRKKHEARPSLADEPHEWFQEANGLLALINHADLRLGIEPSRKEQADLVLAGFLRGLGKVGPLHVVREHDDDGEPQGYRLLSGIEHLTDSYRKAYEKLPDQFRFKNVKEALGNSSGSNTAAMLRDCLSLGLINKTDDGGTRRSAPSNLATDGLNGLHGLSGEDDLVGRSTRSTPSIKPLTQMPDTPPMAVARIPHIGRIMRSD